MMWRRTRKDGTTMSNWCDGCGAEGALPFPNRGSEEYPEWLCINCADLHARNDAALEHFKAYIRPAFRAWVDHWRPRGLKATEIEYTAEAAIAELLSEFGLMKEIRDAELERYKERLKADGRLPGHAS